MFLIVHFPRILMRSFDQIEIDVAHDWSVLERDLRCLPPLSKKRQELFSYDCDGLTLSATVRPWRCCRPPSRSLRCSAAINTVCRLRQGSGTGLSGSVGGSAGASA